MLRFVLVLSLVFLVADAFAQDAKIATLKQLYEQGYYKMVYRRAGRLLMNPAYDQQKEPSTYRNLAIQELAKDPRWAKRHALEIEWMTKPNSTAQKAISQEQMGAAAQVILKEARLHIGVPYKAAGADPTGFDCSGFTYYVFEKQGVKLPRRAADQYTFCQQISPQEAQAGDLVFFSNGAEVNHVGILISGQNAPKQMIHSSSSIGISVVDIESSSYWQPRIVGYGRVLKP